MTPKRLALILLGVLSLIGPAVEAAITGRVEPFGEFGLAETFLAIPLVYWWYHVDKNQQNYHAGPLMNAGVIALTAVALPVYFIRSRGWKRGAIASTLAGMVLAATFVLGELGERIGRAIALAFLLAVSLPASAQERFALDVGAVDLERAGRQEFELPRLPARELTFGLRLRAPQGEKLRHLPGAIVRITLINEKDEVVFSVAEELTNWVRAESASEWFLYATGPQQGAERVAVGPDGGWGTYASLRAAGRYRLAVETVKADVRLSKFDARLVAVGGSRK